MRALSLQVKRSFVEYSKFNYKKSFKTLEMLEVGADVLELCETLIYIS